LKYITCTSPLKYYVPACFCVALNKETTTSIHFHPQVSHIDTNNEDYD
jgi:hypothetical protein